MTFPRGEERRGEESGGAVCVVARRGSKGENGSRKAVENITCGGGAREGGEEVRCFLSMVVAAEGAKGRHEVAAELFVCREQGECRREEADQDVSRVSLSRVIYEGDEEDVDVRPIITQRQHKPPIL